MAAELLTSSDADVQKAGQRLRDGRLCAFATETVYGLGANALNGKAAQRIFEVKGRPPTDPLICHVADFEKALPMWAMGEGEMKVVAALKSLWPGPLTVVGKASELVPSVVHGGSGFVGIRIPNHEVATRLLKAADIPVCAPSANLFGHVSPTQASHVMDDLALRDPTLTVVDGGSCTVGIESTVVKVVSPTEVEVLRKGFLGTKEIEKALAEAGLQDRVSVKIRDTRSKATAKKQEIAQDGPGQLLTHYSPSIPAYLVTPESYDEILQGNKKDEEGEREISAFRIVVSEGSEGSGTELVVSSDKVVVIDFGKYLSALSGAAVAYRSLTSSGDALEACTAAFECLRWSETIDGADAVIFPMATEFYQQDHAREQNDSEVLQLIEAVEDRLYRAASGTIAVVKR